MRSLFLKYGITSQIFLKNGITSYKNCFLPNGLGRDRFQTTEGTEPPEVHKKTIIIWCDQLSCCEMDGGFIQFDQTIERTSRTKIVVQFLTAIKYFGI